MKHILSVSPVACLWLLVSPTARAIIDINNNGLSDLWEKAHNNGDLFPTNFNPQADPDGDGWTNAQEAAAGTHPSDANPPTGYLQPEITYYPAVYSTDPETTQSPATVTLNWPTLPGKQYTLHYSTDLAPGNWSPLGTPRIGTGWDMGKGITLTQPDGSIADRIFWRVAVTDPVPAIDTDGDGLGNYEEYLADTNPVISDSDEDTLSDYAELIAGTNPNHADEDGDGITDPLELAAGTDSKNQDTDGDAIPDWLDNQPLLSAQVFADADDDGIPDANDAAPNQSRGPKPLIISENASGNPNCELEKDKSSNFILTVSNPAGPAPTSSDFKLYLNGTEEAANITALTTPPSATGTQRFNFSWLAKVTTSYPAQTLQNISLRFRDSQYATTWLNVARADVAEWEGRIATLPYGPLSGYWRIRADSHHNGVKITSARNLGASNAGSSVWYRGPKNVSLLDFDTGSPRLTAQITAGCRYPLFFITGTAPTALAVIQTIDISNPDTYNHHGVFYINNHSTAIRMTLDPGGTVTIPPGQLRYQPMAEAPVTGPPLTHVQGFYQKDGQEKVLTITNWPLYSAAGSLRTYSAVNFFTTTTTAGDESLTFAGADLWAEVWARIIPHTAGSLEQPGIAISPAANRNVTYEGSRVPLLPIQSEQWHKLVLKVGPDAGALSNGITLKLGTGGEGENDPQTGFTLQTPGTGGFEPLTIPANGKIELAPTSALYQKLTSLEGLTLFLKRDSTVDQFHRLGLDLIPKRSTYPIQSVAALDVRPIDFVNKDMELVAGLKVGKMENSLSAAGALDIGLDEDRFYVRLPGAAALRNVSIKLATVGNPIATYNDDPTEIALEVNGDDLITKSLLLVSDDVDDDYAGNGVGADDQKNDRTHKVQLGGKVRVESIRIDGIDYPVDAKIPVPVRKKLSERIILVGATSADAVQIASYRDIARERYAQIGVNFDLSITTMAVPAGLDDRNVRATEGGFSQGGQTGFFVHEDVKELVNKAVQEDKMGTVTVFVVRDVAGTGARGFALRKGRSHPTEMQYAHVAVISAQETIRDGTFRFTLAHEVGHLVTDNSHYGIPESNNSAQDFYGNGSDHQIIHNLMRDGTSADHTIQSSKRLHVAQEEMLLPELLIAP